VAAAGRASRAARSEGQFQPLSLFAPARPAPGSAANPDSGGAHRCQPETAGPVDEGGHASARRYGAALPGGAAVPGEWRGTGGSALAERGPAHRSSLPGSVAGASGAAMKRTAMLATLLAVAIVAAGLLWLAG